MSSSVASGKVMERWARERDEQKNPRVHMPKAAQDTFNAMKPDFAALEKFEQKREQVIDRLTERENGLEVEEVINVMGSTAGAGSGDFHTYRGYRTKELARLRDMDEERKEVEAATAWEKERAERAAEVESKAAKRAAKRQRQKENKKAKTSADDTPGSSSAAGAEVASAGGGPAVAE
eukprot:Transcript_6828.p3 GENE.Transcript_6828~~Transcript_6828.p3  ORF type:complete len:198 (-),score=66.89 Transcript_6828:1852-2385(-)